MTSTPPPKHNKNKYGLRKYGSLGLKKVIVTSLTSITSNFSETLRVTSTHPLEAIPTIRTLNPWVFGSYLSIPILGLPQEIKLEIWS